MNKTCRVVIFAAALSLSLSPPHEARQSESAERADRYFEAKNWAAAARDYQQLTQTHPKDGRLWFQLGSALKELRELRRSVDAFERALALGFAPVTSTYNLAKVHALAGDKERGLEWLGKLADAGYGRMNTVRDDPDLAALRGDPRFAVLLERIDRNGRPCAYSKEARQFDFWIGDWDVYTPQGQLAGTNSVKLVLGDCVLFENWSGAGGGEGKSFNLFNAATGEWRQTWVDARGGMLEFRGAFIEGEIRFRGESVGPDGRPILHKLTFFNLGPDRVRQLWEQSGDGGKSWSTVFDGLYKRKE